MAQEDDALKELRREREQYRDDALGWVTWERDQSREALVATVMTAEAYAEDAHERAGVECVCPEPPSEQGLEQDPQTGGWGVDYLVHGYPPRVLNDSRRLLELIPGRSE